MYTETCQQNNVILEHFHLGMCHKNSIAYIFLVNTCGIICEMYCKKLEYKYLEYFKK